MPRELKKRGRREEKKRKAPEDPSAFSPKRQRQDLEEDQDVEIDGNAGDDFIRLDPYPVETEQVLAENQFYGLLDEDEQAYYSSVNAKLTANDFESDEDRLLFVQAVHRETSGKELKVASSQSCSRYLEKIIMLSTADQLRALFTAFLEDLTYLVQHRFGSHCCEALFIQSSKFLKPDRVTKDDDANLEDLFTLSVERLKPNLGFSVTDRFASHCIRVLLLILAGDKVESESNRVLASRKKEKIDLPDSWERTKATSVQPPKSFHKAREDLITGAFAGLDTTYVRALATHPIGNPFLQVVLKVELTLHASNKERAQQLLFPNLFPDQDFDVESDTGRFIQGLLYDPAGSHLVETLVMYLPGRLFKKLYANILKERMHNLVKNDIASYVAIRVIERLGKDDLVEVCNAVQQEIPPLIERSRFGLLKVLFERFVIRRVDSQSLVTILTTHYGNDKLMFLTRLIQFREAIDNADSRTGSKQEKQGSADLHGSLLVQAMVKDPKGAAVVQESFLAQSSSDLDLMSKNNIASRAVQAILTSDQASVQFRKQAIPKFFGNIADLAVTAAGSHVVDALWQATSGIHFLKEKVARELAAKEAVLRESIYGRTVWRNWSMDLHQRRPGEWHALAKGPATRNVEQPAQGEDGPNEAPKSAIQLARERFARTKARRNGSEMASAAPLVAG